MNTPCSGPHFLKHGKDSRAAWKELCRTGQEGQPMLPARMRTWCLCAPRGSTGNPPHGRVPRCPFSQSLPQSHSYLPLWEHRMATWEPAQGEAELEAIMGWAILCT